MNYIYEKVKLANNHPQWPGESGFKIRYLKTDELCWAFYLQESDAIKYTNLKNERGY